MQPRHALLLAAALVVLGCGGPTLTGTTVTGDVTLDGAPLDAGTVYLIGPDEATARNTDVQKGGTFRFIDVAPGKYKVLVKEPVDVPVEYDAKGKGVSRGRRPVIPAKYQDVKRTPLAVEVTPDAKLSLALQSK